MAPPKPKEILLQLWKMCAHHSIELVELCWEHESNIWNIFLDGPPLELLESTDGVTIGEKNSIFGTIV